MGPKMPTVSLVCESQTDTTSAIRNSLTAAFANGTTHHGLDGRSADSVDLHHQLTSSAKLALLADIDYEETSSSKSASPDNVKAKYTTLLPTSASAAASAAIAASPCNNVNGKLGMYGSPTTDKSSNGTGNLIQYSDSCAVRLTRRSCPRRCTACARALLCHHRRLLFRPCSLSVCSFLSCVLCWVVFRVAAAHIGDQRCAFRMH